MSRPSAGRSGAGKPKPSGKPGQSGRSAPSGKPSSPGAPSSASEREIPASSGESTDIPEPAPGDVTSTGPSSGTASAGSPTEIDEGDQERSPQADDFWRRVRVDPVEIALPEGVGYTLRAYRPDSDITPSDYAAREEVSFPARAVAVDDEDESDDEVDTLDDEDDQATDEVTDAEATDDDAEDDGAEDAEDESEDGEVEESGEDADADSKAAAARADEEVPLFLSHAGHVLVFRTRAGLVDFVRSDAEHDLTQLDTWDRLVEDIRPEYVAALPDDTYELDLVVKNLRGAHEAWDPELVVRAGQVARDLGHALRIEPVVLALAPGSPLDDLDEALRGVAGGGVGAFFARRKAKKIGTETASLSWRTVIGKISAVVDWRD